MAEELERRECCLTGLGTIRNKCRLLCSYRERREETNVGYKGEDTVVGLLEVIIELVAKT